MEDRGRERVIGAVRWGAVPWGAALVAIGFAVVFAASMLGIWSRTSSLLASFWPANALLLGVLVRWPVLARIQTWVGAVLGFLAADLLTGSEMFVTVGLTAGNLAGVLVGWLLLRRWSVADRSLAEPRAVLRLIGVGAAAAAAATFVGAPVGVISFDYEIGAAIQTWYSGEFANYLALLPALLTSRALRIPTRSDWPAALAASGPVLALPFVVVIGLFLDGPFVLTAILPVLLWSAMQGDVFRTSLMVLLTTAWSLLALGSGMMELHLDTLAASDQVSLQGGLALVTAGPLMIAAAIRAREEALQRVRILAEYDALTGVLNRRAFLDAGERVLARARVDRRPVSVLMLDLDEFKQVNDRFGHPGGDAVLAAAGPALVAELRPGDLVGRLGGEEFAVLAAGLDAPQASALAERLREGVRRSRPEQLGEWRVTASVGVRTIVLGPETTLGSLLSAADKLLYAAKQSGRDRVCAEPAG